MPEATDVQKEGARVNRGRRGALLTAGGAVLVAAFSRAAGAARALFPAPEDEPPAPVYGHGLLVQLEVDNLDRSLRFYTEVLGFRVTERRDDLQFVHVDCGVPGLEIGLSAGDTKPRVPGSVVLNFSVSGDLEKVRARLEQRGVRFTGPTQVIAGKVRLASFQDPDGYRLRLAGDDPLHS